MFLQQTTQEKLMEMLWKVLDWFATSGVKLGIALFVSFIACKIINVFAKAVRKGMEKRKLEKTITQVTYSFLRKSLKVIVFICFLGYVGIDTASLASLIAAVGVGISLALQGALSNFAGGLVILITHPFKLGDYIEAQEVSGTVEDIEMFYTYLRTPDNKIIMIPNGVLANDKIINFSTKALRRVDLAFRVSHYENYSFIRELIYKIAIDNESVFEEPEPFIRIKQFEKSALEITCRLWCKNEDYWTVYFYMMENIKIAFDKHQIKIPHNQLEVHLKER